MSEQPTNEKDLRLTYKVEELAPILGIGRNSAYERSGQIRSFRVGRAYRVPKDAVEEFLRKTSD